MVIGEENEVKRGLFIFFKVKELREYCMLLEVIQQRGKLYERIPRGMSLLGERGPGVEDRQRD